MDTMEANYESYMPTSLSAEQTGIDMGSLHQVNPQTATFKIVNTCMHPFFIKQIKVFCNTAKGFVELRIFGVVNIETRNPETRNFEPGTRTE